MNISEVSLSNQQTEYKEQETLELSLQIYRILLTQLSRESDNWITAFDKNIRQAPTLNYLLRQVSNMMPATNIYRQLMFDVLHENLNLTYPALQQSSVMNTSTIEDVIGRKFECILLFQMYPRGK